MSAINMHPPQTYSRLFRPWDNNKTTINSDNRGATLSSFVKKENCGFESGFKTDHSSFKSSDSDRECASNSSFKSSHEDNEPNCSQLRTIVQHEQPQLSPQSAQNMLLVSRLCQKSEPHNQLHLLNSMPTTNNDFFYAAAAAAAASTVNGVAAASSVPVHFGVDPYTIGLMEQEYARVMAEEAHIKALNARKQRPKKFKCPHCDVAFSNNGQLKGHIRIHTGERPFKCDIETCGKTFTRNEELTRHKRIHTGLRPYPCSVCGKKFGRRDHLKKHMKTHLPQERQLGPAIFVPMYPYLYGY